ncbi:GDSL esterase/lipase 7-like [Corylus avellana]|uniref:GDSL esterase/lipase 7-like n=1 Tax=Corylus avellana TaxID=13451 RepID=UPI002869FC04|nr:GDSL esterase/lipase 7-like [Corylus avellana]
MGAILAVQLCQELGLQRFQLEGDAKNVIEAVTSKNPDDSSRGQLIVDIRSYLRPILAWEMRYVRRDGNKVAHALARMAIKDTIFGSVKPDADHHHDHQIATENIVLPAPLVPGLYVFGDSQVDTGLNTNLDTLMTATYKPFGIDFTIGATGRFSNGAVITDFIGHDLQLPTTLTYGAYKSLDEVVTSGFSYASASAGILHETGHGPGENWSMEKQIVMFNKTVHENLRRHINSTELPKYLSECIFLVFIGASDYEINFLQVYYNTSKKYTNEEFGTLLAMKLAYQSKDLYKLGARRIVVFEIGPIGCYPASLKVFEPQTKCAEDINEMVMIFNRNLHIKIEALRSKLKDATILIAEMYGLIRDMIDMPSSYGFTDIRNTLL